MRRICTTAIALIALAVVPAAFAKGPTEARISGPGIGKTIVAGGDAESGAPSDFGTLVEGLGFFPAAFGQQPDPMLLGRPGGDLGPKYVVAYHVPTGETSAVEITQDVYPYADGGPVSYMRPRQPLFGTAVPGGWFRADDAVKPILVGYGLPSNAPGRGGGSDLLGPFAVFTAVLLAGALLVVALTRRAAAAEAGHRLGSLRPAHLPIHTMGRWTGRSTCCTSAVQRSSASTCSTRRTGSRSSTAGRRRPSRR